ncbi:MAG TPA: hypothetical protein VHU80_21525 [Polyangiaceae bacterium]|nr:hypothetical protein [Polyangiaceae bacterium]
MSCYLARIQKGVDCIETRLDEDIELASVAKVAGLSQWHFQRIFKALGRAVAIYGADLEMYGAEYHPTRDDSVIYYAIPTS